MVVLLAVEMVGMMADSRVVSTAVMSAVEMADS